MTSDNPMTTPLDNRIIDLREAMANLKPSPSVEPNDVVTMERVFTPSSHRAVLDLGRQLVVGNRGMGKSLWTHALLNDEVRQTLADSYNQPQLANTRAVIGFNGSSRLSEVAPTRDAIERAIDQGHSEDDVWRAVLYRVAMYVSDTPNSIHLDETIAKLKADPTLYEHALFTADQTLAQTQTTVLILFDALDRLADNWERIRKLTSSLFRRISGLKSFRSFRAKVFIRPDQYADQQNFQFQDASKLKNDSVDLTWEPYELFGLLFFELLRSPAGPALNSLAREIGADAALSFTHRARRAVDEQTLLVNKLAGPFMGSNATRGKVYTWVPLHLSDARNACSPRSFLTAWQQAAQHEPAPIDRVVDHLGLNEGVRNASEFRLNELREDYRWIDFALGALKGEFVPIEKDALYTLWSSHGVLNKIISGANQKSWLTPVDVGSGNDRDTDLPALLETMKSIAVLEERSNGKINAPDIFRVEAGIKRKGGVAVPRKK